MASSATASTASHIHAAGLPKELVSTSSKLTSPLRYTGILDHYEHFDVTPAIGRDFSSKLQLSSIIHDDDAVKDLAVLVSQRGVVFFRNQDISIEDHKYLAQRLGELTGKPNSSKLFKHPIARHLKSQDDSTIQDPHVSAVDSEHVRRNYGQYFSQKAFASSGWHSDATFDEISPDYSLLKMTLVPSEGGGDTAWASAYEAYDRLSAPIQKLAEGLQAVHSQPSIGRIQQQAGEEGAAFEATHPVVRTNPVTGWKALFGAGSQIDSGHFIGLTATEDQILKRYFLRIIAENHDLQCRIRWQENDLAIWDNRATFHSATNDYDGARRGYRVTGIGEKPYLDPASVSRREALGLQIN